MWRPALLIFLFSSVPFAQTTESSIFRAVLLPASETPAVANLNARGAADVTISILRDASGQIVSGTVDILAHVTFPAAAVATGLGIWSGNTGQAGTLAFNSTLSAQLPFNIQANGDTIHLAVQVPAENTVGVAALRALYANPTAYYVNLLTTANPNGAMRGQLQRAQKLVLLALLSSNNVVPVAYPQGYGAAQVVAIGTRDAAGNWTSGEILSSASFYSQDPTSLTSMQIHIGSAGTNGALALTAPLPAGITPVANGSTVVGPYYTEISTTTAIQTGTFTNLFTNPGVLYLDLHTSGSPNGSLRGQLHATDAMTFPLLLNSANETAATNVTSSAAGSLTLYTLRHEDGSIAAGTFLTDLNYRWPAPMQFLGLYLHSAVAGHSGPIALQVAPDFHTDSGFGNYFGWSFPFADAASLSTMNGLVAQPAAYYADLHSISDPGGAARAQLAALSTPGSVVTAVVSATLDPSTSTSLVPGGLISIFGTNLARVATDLSGWSGQTLPYTLNGVHVTIGGRPAPLLYVSPSQINAQVPLDMPLPPIAFGQSRTAMVLVSDSNGALASETLRVDLTQPSIFFSPSPAILKNADFSLVSAANPCKPGDVILIYGTGMGETTPPIVAGQILPNGLIANTLPPSVSIGGRPASVIYSIASPAFPGLYQVAVTVPAGITGASPLVMQQGAATSNTVVLMVR